MRCKVHGSDIPRSTRRKIKKAEDIFCETFQILTRLLGAEHPKTVTHIYNLAATYRSQRRYDEAEVIQLNAKGINEKTRGQEREDTIICSNNLAWIWRGQGCNKEALDLLAKSVDLFNASLGADHPYTISVTKVLHQWSEEDGG